MFSKPTILCVALAVAGVALAAPGRALADDTASCSVIEIGATNAKDPSIPPGLKPLEKKLKKPPLSSWNSFKVMSSTTLNLSAMRAAPVKLATGQASLMLREIEKREGKRPRLALAVTMDDASGKRVVDSKVSVDAGDTLMVGSLVNDDGHFLAISCKP
ncbi:MAG: hypothetical protein K8W52_25455 [Deltaproteobacteria bacterium]|nr:hypothetical protein [Deltaproteobacteria bacterium]